MTDQDPTTKTDTAPAGPDATATEGAPAAAEEWKPPTRDEYERITSALTKANGEAKRHREEAAALKKAGMSEAEKAAADATSAAEAAAAARYKPIAVRAEARAALLAAGLQGNPDTVARLVDVGAVEIGEDGSMTGLDTAVAQIKKDFPDLFKRRAVGSADGGARTPAGAPDRKLTPGEQIAASLGLGKS